MDTATYHGKTWVIVAYDVESDHVTLAGAADERLTLHRLDLEEPAPKALTDYPMFPNIFDVKNHVWYRSEGPYVNTLHLRDEAPVKRKQFGSIYIPKDGSAPYAAVMVGNHPSGKHDKRNQGNGLTVEQLMKWVEETMGITARKLA
jgi:hypothetical protein